jgi:hypothetical protein
MNFFTSQRHIVASVLLTGALAGEATAQTEVGSVSITRIRTGWAGDTFAIETAQPISNPANCSTPDAYLIASPDPGYKTHYAATLTAFALGKQVTVIVSNTECSFGRPKIWGIYLPATP